MPPRSPPGSPPGLHDNNFGVLRLAFASMVILGHVPEQLDGDRHREPLLNVFHTITFGDLAVDFFFLISGYLITLSWRPGLRSAEFLWRRVLRIYPAFLVVSLIGFLVISPLVGARLAELTPKAIAVDIARLMVLCPIEAPGAFPHMPSSLMNASIWTLRCEFRCYLLVMLLGSTGLLGRRWLILAGAVLLLAGALLPPVRDLPPLLTDIFGWPHEDMRLTGLFLAGASFLLFRDRISWDARLAALALAMMILLLFTPLAETGVAIFGGYAVFWLATELKSPWLARINNRDDLSYGVYLYAWPVANTIIFFARETPLAILIVSTLAGSLAMAACSWVLIEKPVLSLKRSSLFWGQVIRQTI